MTEQEKAERCEKLEKAESRGIISARELEVMLEALEAETEEAE